MAKVTLTTLSSLTSESSALAALNANFAEIAAAIEDQISRSGTAPNTMDDVLDMNNQRVINLPAPVDYTDAARHGDLQLYVDAAEAAQLAAETAEANAELAETNAETAEAAAELAQSIVQSIYLGDFATAPTVDLDTAYYPLYYDTTLERFRFQVVEEVYVLTDEVLAGVHGVRVGYWVTLPWVALGDAVDVDVSTPPTDGQVLAWDDPSNTWIPDTVARPADIPDVPTEVSIVDDTANRILALSDSGKYLRMSHSTGVSVTVPPNADVAFPVGTMIMFRQVGNGEITFTPGSGVTINNKDGLVTIEPKAVATLIKVATNEWDIWGELTT